MSRLYWRLQRVQTLVVTAEEWMPLERASLNDVKDIIERAAINELTSVQARRAQYLWRCRDVTADGPRLCFEAGLDPYYTASLWREDEMASTAA